MSAPSWFDWNDASSAFASRAMARQRSTTSSSVVVP